MGPDRYSASIRRRTAGCPFPVVLLTLLLSVLLLVEAASAQSTVTTASPSNQPLTVTAERIDHLQEQEVYEADGSVVVTQGSFRLTADHVTINSLPGTLVATGHVHFFDPSSDLKSERLELNVNTEAGVITHGSMYIRPSNSFLPVAASGGCPRITIASRRGRSRIVTPKTAKCRPGDSSSTIST